MRYLVIGHGAREYAITARLREEGHFVANLAALPNDGLAILSDCFGISNDYSTSSISSFAKENTIGCIIVGNETPLFNGAVDDLQAYGFLVFGPVKAVAELEQNKPLARMIGHKVDPLFSINSVSFEDGSSALDYLKRIEHPHVIKYTDTHGRSLVAFSESGCDLHIEKIRQNDRQLNVPIVVEDFCPGQDFSIYVISDGDNAYFTRAIQDYPFRLEGGLGAKTGGMGSVMASSSHLPFMTHNDYQRALLYCKKFLIALVNEVGVRPKGIFSFQFIKTADALKFNEIDVRAGDPEIVNFLYSLSSSFSELVDGVVQEHLMPPRFNNKASVVRYFVSPSYPEVQLEPIQFTIDEHQMRSDGIDLFWGNAINKNGIWSSGSSRTVLLGTTGKTVKNAYDKLAQAETLFITDGEASLEARKDIGKYDEGAKRDPIWNKQNFRNRSSVRARRPRL